MRRNAETQKRKDDTDMKKAGINHRIKDMSIRQERKDDRKNERHNYIHNVILHDGKASKSKIFPKFSG